MNCTGSSCIISPIRHWATHQPKKAILMPHPQYSAEEIVRRGEEIYEQEIRPKVEKEHKGKFLVIDVETGAYEIDEEDLTASERLLARKPDAELYGVRIGYPTAYRLGGHFALQQPYGGQVTIEPLSP
jgi:hypothetical protein